MSHVAAAARFVVRKCLALSFAFVVHCVVVVLCVLVDKCNNLIVVWGVFVECLCCCLDMWARSDVDLRVACRCGRPLCRM